MIPTTIQKGHILMAAEWIDKNGVGGRSSRKYVVIIEGKPYPPKLVISRAYFYAHGSEWSHENFTGGKEANSFLRRLGFEIKKVDSLLLDSRANPQRRSSMTAHQPTSRSALNRVWEIARTLGVHLTRMESQTGDQNRSECLIWHAGGDSKGRVLIVNDGRGKEDMLHLWTQVELNSQTFGFVGGEPEKEYSEFMQGLMMGRTEFKLNFQERRLTSVDLGQAVFVCEDDAAFAKMLTDAVVEILATYAVVMNAVVDAQTSSGRSSGRSPQSTSRDSMYA